MTCPICGKPLMPFDTAYCSECVALADALIDAEDDEITEEIPIEDEDGNPTDLVLVPKKRGELN